MAEFEITDDITTGYQVCLPLAVRITLYESGAAKK